jgi:hypothetical protein
MSLSKLQANKLPPKNAIFDETRQERRRLAFFKTLFSFHYYDVIVIMTFGQNLFVFSLGLHYFTILWAITSAVRKVSGTLLLLLGISSNPCGIFYLQVFYTFPTFIIMVRFPRDSRFQISRSKRASLNTLE